MKCFGILCVTLCLSAYLSVGANPLGDKAAAPTSPVVLENNAKTSKDAKGAAAASDGKDLLATLASNKTEEYNKPKIRKVTQVESYEVVDKKVATNELNVTTGSTSTTSTTTAVPVIGSSAAPKVHTVKVAEGEYLQIPVTKLEADSNTATTGDKDLKPKLLTNETKTTVVAANIGNVNETNANVNHTAATANKTNSTITVEMGKPLSTPSPTAKASSAAAANDTKVVTPSLAINSPNVTASTITTASTVKNIPTSTSTTTTSTTTTTTTTTTTSTTTTTTTTTPKPKKPKITYGVEDFPDLDKESLAFHNLTQKQQSSSTSQSASKLPSPEAPYAQPSQEFSNTSFHGGQDYILPVVSMIFIIPLVIGILITTYRRFRDCWSTRHYRRMDFLVDGMYND